MVWIWCEYTALASSGKKKEKEKKKKKKLELSQKIRDGHRRTGGWNETYTRALTIPMFSEQTLVRFPEPCVNYCARSAEPGSHFADRSPLGRASLYSAENRRDRVKGCRFLCCFLGSRGDGLAGPARALEAGPVALWLYPPPVCYQGSKSRFIYKITFITNLYMHNAQGCM